MVGCVPAAESVALDTAGVAPVVNAAADGTVAVDVFGVEVGLATVVSAVLDTPNVEEPAMPAVVVVVVDVDFVARFAVAAVDGAVEVVVEEVVAGVAVVVVVLGLALVVLSACADAAPHPISSTLSAIERTTKPRNFFWSM